MFSGKIVFHSLKPNRVVETISRSFGRSVFFGRLSSWGVSVLAFGLVISLDAGETVDPSVLIDEDGSWCWYQDERAIIDGDKLIFQSSTTAGETVVVIFDLENQERHRVVLSEEEYPETVINGETFHTSDHNMGGIMVRPDGRYLAVYAGHDTEERMRYRVSEAPGDPTEWGPERYADTGALTTYSNVYRLEEEGITYNFYRGADWDPHYMVSEDDGDTWEYGGRLMTFDGRPYPRFASDGKKRIHFVTTEHHPRNYDNSIYHGYIEGGALFQSDGTYVAELSSDSETDVSPKDFTRVFAGDQNNVAWTSDIELDEQGRPYVGYWVTKDPLREGRSMEEAGMDHHTGMLIGMASSGTITKSLTPAPGFTWRRWSTPV